MYTHGRGSASLLRTPYSRVSGKSRRIGRRAGLVARHVGGVRPHGIFGRVGKIPPLSSAIRRHNGGLKPVPGGGAVNPRAPRLLMSGCHRQNPACSSVSAEGSAFLRLHRIYRRQSFLSRNATAPRRGRTITSACSQSQTLRSTNAMPTNNRCNTGLRLHVLIRA